MATLLKIGPADHGRPLLLDEFLKADYEEGYQYELIDGKLYVSPKANAPQGRLEKWVYRKLDRYSELHPEIANFVHFGARVFVPERIAVTTPEPDVAVYADFPLDLWDGLRWQDVSPFLVVEV